MSAKSKRKIIPSVPPGFGSLTSFLLKKVEKSDESECDPISMESILKLNDTDALKAILKKHPWILFDQSDHDLEKSHTQHFPQGVSSNARRPKGVTHGCPDCSDCLKVVTRWCPEDARRDILDEAQTFRPTEEEFKDTLEYIASIRAKAEPYGICRIIPPPTWQPQCLLKEKQIWENSKFVTRIQRIDGIQEIESKHGPTFSLSTFKKFADNFKAMYFNCVKSVLSSDEKWEPSVENIEGEYGRIIQNPTHQIEVFLGDDLGAGVLSSGFPVMSDPLESLKYAECMRSGWNLNNMLTQSGSLLSFESSEVTSKFAPCVRVGMCFSSFSWEVEEHHLYSLCYMHVGEPRIWYSIPGRSAADFETVRKKHLPFAEQPDWHDNLLSSTVLKSEGIPVYRCVQYPGEFVLVFPGAYHSGFDCGFNCSESVSFAPLDWLLHGQKVEELYCERRRKTSISYDKLLLGAARKAVRAQFEIELCSRGTPDDLKWKDTCGKNGKLTKAFDLRKRSESSKRKFLGASLKSRRMEKDFDATRKRECCICLRDLHLSAIGCPCSTDKFACLDHAKQFCSCPWADRFILNRYEMSELDILHHALEGKASLIHKWAKLDLGLSMHSSAPKRDTASSSSSNRAKAFLNSLKQRREAFESEVTGTAGKSSSIMAIPKSPLPESKAKKVSVGHQSIARHVKNGVDPAAAIKLNPMSHKVQSLPKNDPKGAKEFLGLSLTSGCMALLPKIRAYDVSSDSSSSSDSNDAT